MVFDHLGVRARSKGELSTRPCRAESQTHQRRWARAGDSSSTTLSLCGLPRLQHVADECRAHVVLCPGTRLRARDNRGYHTEKLRGGYWALHFGWRREPLTNASAGCTVIFSRRIKRHNLYRIVPAPAAIAGTRANGEITQWTLRLDSAGGISTAAYGKWRTTTGTGEGYPPDNGIPRKKIAEAKQRRTPILELDLNSGLGLKGASEQVEEPFVG